MKLHVWNKTLMAVMFATVISIGLCILAVPEKVYGEETSTPEMFQAGEQIPINTVVDGIAYKEGALEDHYYRFILTEPGLVNLQLNHEVETDDTGYISYEMYLCLTPDRENRLEFYSFVEQESTSTSSVALGSGEYYIKISTTKRSPSAYQLKVNFEKTNRWETELNNTTETADEIEVNNIYYGNIYNSHRFDYYKVTLPKPGTVSVSLTHALMQEASMYNCFEVSFYDEQLNLYSKENSTGTDAEVHTREIGVPAGTYYVRVMGKFDSHLDYGLQVTYNENFYWESEFNDKHDRATEIKTGQSYYGYAADEKDIDFYKFKMKKDGYVTIHMTHSSEENDPPLYYTVYDEKMSRVSYYAFVSPEEKSYTSQKIGLKKGNYYIGVCTIEENPYTEMYTLSVRETAVSDWESEYNGSIYHANKIAFENVIKGVGDVTTYTDEVESDCYTFSLKNTAYISLKLSQKKEKKSSDKWRVEIVDTGGRCVSEKSYMTVKSSDVSKTIENIKLPKGTYYVKVTPYEVAEGKEYELLLNKVEKKAPTLTKVEATQYNKIKLSWKEVSGAEKYEIYRSASKNGTYKKVKTISKGTTTSWTDKNVKTGKTYYYKMKTVVKLNKEEKSGYSKVKSVKCVPAKPTVTLKAGSKKITISWKKVSGANGYEIYRAASKKGTYKKVTTIKKGTTVTYTNKKLTKGKKYYYKVRAYRTANGKKVYSGYSEIESVKAK